MSKYTNIENDYRVAGILFTRAEWKRRGYLVNADAKGVPYQYYHPKCRTACGRRYSIDEVHRRMVRRGSAAYRLQRAMGSHISRIA